MSAARFAELEQRIMALEGRAPLDSIAANPLTLDPITGAVSPPPTGGPVQAGPLFGSSAASNARPGFGLAWGTPANAEVQDGAVATATVTPNPPTQTSVWLTVTGFGFAIPSTATILGVLVGVLRSSGLGLIADSSLKLWLAGAVSGTEHASATAWPTALTWANYGSPTDTWGIALTAAQVNDPGFGVALSAFRRNVGGAQSDTGNVDAIRMSVYYQ